jgi:hypothetical protein
MRRIPVLVKKARAIWQVSIEEISTGLPPTTILVWKTNETLDVVIKT